MVKGASSKYNRFRGTFGPFADWSHRKSAGRTVAAKNKAKAFSILRARLAALERDKELLEQRKMRTDQVSSTDRSDKIRTYNYPQNRVTDHRCGYSLHDLTGCMSGARLQDVIDKVEEFEFESRLEELIRQDQK